MATEAETFQRNCKHLVNTFLNAEIRRRKFASGDEESDSPRVLKELAFALRVLWLETIEFTQKFEPIPNFLDMEHRDLLILTRPMKPLFAARDDVSEAVHCADIVQFVLDTNDNIVG